MICQKCGMAIQDGRDYCINCGARVEKKPDDMIGSEYDAGSSYGSGSSSYSSGPKSRYINEQGKFSQTKTGILLMAGGEILIGLFVAFYAFVQFSDIDPGLAMMLMLGFAVWAAGLPLIGLILVAVGVNKPGGVILIIGSIICIPIGMLGVYAGINAMKLDS